MPCHGSPSSGNSQRLAAFAARVDRREPDGAVVGVVHRAAFAPRETEVRRDHDVGAEPPERRGEVAAEGNAVFDRAVGMPEEFDVVHTHERRALSLLLLAQRRHLLGRHAVDTGLAARGQHVSDLLALSGPAGDRARHAVLEVVRVRDDRDRALPVLRDRFHWAPRTSMAAPVRAGRSTDALSSA